MKGSGRRMWVTAACSAALAAVALAVWCVLGYLHVVRQQVAIADACSRVEAASRSRLELVRNLTVASPAASERGRVTLEDAVRRVAALDLAPGDAAVELAGYREAQEALSAALSAFHSTGADADSTTKAVLGAYASKLERWESRLAEQLDRLETGLRSYDALSRRFPGSLMASIARLEVGDPQRLPRQVAPR